MNIESIKDYLKKIPEKGGMPKKGAVVCVGLMLAGTMIGFSAHHAKLENQYEQAIELTCNEQYDEALTLLEQLGDYEDSESLREFIAINQDFSIEDKDSYIDVLAKLEDMDFSDDAELEDHFETFEQKVESLQQQYEKDQEQAQRITLKISNIAGGDLTALTLDDESSVTEARKLYDKGNESVRELVYNYSKLLKAEQAMEKLVEHRDLCMEKAKPAVDAITAIGDVTLDSKDSITNARTIYDGLSSEEYKKYVTNYETLVSAEKKYSELEQEEIRKQKEAEQAAQRQQQEEQQQQQQNSYSDYSSATVYWVANGSVYHCTSSCPTLARSKHIYSGTVSQSGKPRPCKVCYH